MVERSNSDTAALALQAFVAAGCKTHPEFVAWTGGALKLRTFRYWLTGERRPSDLEQAALRAMATGWRPPA